MTTFIQILSRLVLVWGVLVPIPAARSSIGVPMLLVAWSIAECTRYFYYGFHLYDSAPHFATWLRYTLFIVLYPMGVSGELLTTYAALPTISAAKMWSIELPNIFNISFYYDYVLVLFMLSYLHCKFLGMAFCIDFNLIIFCSLPSAVHFHAEPAKEVPRRWSYRSRSC